MVERVCQHCGKAYRTQPSIRLKYCSMACTGAAKIRAVDVPCEVCGTPFRRYPSRPDRRYCSKSCARTALNRTEANPSFTRDISGEKNPMYGRRSSRIVGDPSASADGPRTYVNGMLGRTKDRSSRWKGGVKTRKDGYRYVVAPDDHPSPAYTKASGTKYILEHRRVMEVHLGRYLTPEEVVHHIDGDTSNNAIENLQLFASQADHIRIGHGQG